MGPRFRGDDADFHCLQWATAGSAEVGAFCPPLELFGATKSTGCCCPPMNTPGFEEEPQRNANGAYLCATSCERR